MQGMARKKYTIEAVWYDDDKVWVATSPDLPGLVTEAKNFENLRRRVALLLPDFLECLNDGKPKRPKKRLTPTRFDVVQVAYA
jgi:hypothetical protein